MSVSVSVSVSVAVAVATAKAAAAELTKRLTGKTLVCDAVKAERAAKIKAEKDAWEKELDNSTHEKTLYSLDMIEENAKEKTFNGGVQSVLLLRNCHKMFSLQRTTSSSSLRLKLCLR